MHNTHPRGHTHNMNLGGHTHNMNLGGHVLNQDNPQSQFNSTEDSSTTKSFRFSRPNYTQTPNDYYDHVMPSLKTVGEHAVMQVVIRQTIGWGNKEWDRISITQMMKKTGLSRSTVKRSIKKLIDRDLIVLVRKGRSGEQESYFKLNIEDPEFVSENPEFSNNLDRVHLEPGRGFKMNPTKETNTKDTKKKVVKVIERKAKAPPPPSFSQKRKSEEQATTITDEQKAELIAKIGEKEASKRIANAIKTLTNPRFANSPYRSMSVYDLALLYHENSKKERSETTEGRKEQNKEKTKSFLQANPHLDMLELTQNAVIFHHNGQGEEPTVFYKSTQFDAEMKEILDRWRLEYTWPPGVH